MADERVEQFPFPAHYLRLLNFVCTNLTQAIVMSSTNNPWSLSNSHLAENDSIGFLNEGMLKSNLTTSLDDSQIEVYFKKVLIVIRLILFESMILL